MMNDIFHKLIIEGVVVVYLDDILIYTKTVEEHWEIMQWVLELLSVRLKGAVFWPWILPENEGFLDIFWSFFWHFLADSNPFANRDLSISQYIIFCVCLVQTVHEPVQAGPRTILLALALALIFKGRSGSGPTLALAIFRNIFYYV